jgi:hypothetical protein
MRRCLPLLTVGAALVAGAAAAEPRACPAGLHHATTAELYFGRAVEGAGDVSDADWRDFVDREVTPRFPDGLSVGDVYGQWRDPKGALVREASKAVFIVLTDAPAETRNLDLVREAYKQRFHQRAVMLVEQPACVGF